MEEAHGALRNTFPRMQRMQDAFERSYHISRADEAAPQRNFERHHGELDLLKKRNIFELHKLTVPMLGEGAESTDCRRSSYASIQNDSDEHNAADAGACSGDAHNHFKQRPETWKSRPSGTADPSSISLQQHAYTTSGSVNSNIGSPQRVVNCDGSREKTRNLPLHHLRLGKELSLKTKMLRSADGLNCANKRRIHGNCCAGTHWKPSHGFGRERLQLGPKCLPLRNAQAVVDARSLSSSALEGKTFWIHIWPCFGTTGSSLCTPTRIVVHKCYCYMEQLTEKAASATDCRPAPNVLYEPDGHVVRSLLELIPEQHYLLFPGGGLYRKKAVPVALLEQLVKAAKERLYQRR